MLVPLPSPCGCQRDLCWRTPAGEMGCELWVLGEKPILGHSTDPRGLGTSLPGWCHMGDVFKVFWGSSVGHWPVSLSFPMASVPAWAGRYSSFSLCSWGASLHSRHPQNSSFKDAHPKELQGGSSSDGLRGWGTGKDTSWQWPEGGPGSPLSTPCPSCTLGQLSPSVKPCQDVTSVPKPEGQGEGGAPGCLAPCGVPLGLPGLTSIPTATGGC